MIEASAPGKLYIAGEYAVVEPGYPAILTAVDQFLTVRLEAAKEKGSIRSFQYGNFPIQWTRKNGKLQLDKRESTFHYILAAIEVTETYAVEQQKPLALYHLTVESNLDSETGLKYGLGSSGAVTVATVRALCRLYELDESDELVFKLASLAHLSLDSNGSFGDVAASAYTGWLAYTSFDREWVRKSWSELPITQLIQSEWPGLSVRRLTPPDHMKFVIGWTGSPASTTQLVDQVQEKRKERLESYREFLTQSKTCVEQMIQGFHTVSLSTIQNAIRQNRSLLNQLGSHTGVEIETPALQTLCQIAEEEGGAAKTSGAGGGDCGIALFDRQLDLHALYDKWADEGIVPLPLTVYTKLPNTIKKGEVNDGTAT